MAPLSTKTKRNGLSDHAIWVIGAVALLVPIMALDSIFFFIPKTPHPELLKPSSPHVVSLCIAALVSFVVAFKSRRAGLAKALSYLLFIALVAYAVSVGYGMLTYGNQISHFFHDPAGHGNIPVLWVHLHTKSKILGYTPPIAAGALCGWLVRRLRK